MVAAGPRRELIKFRVRPGEIEIATVQGEPIVRAVGSNTRQAIKRLAGLFDALEKDEVWLQCQKEKTTTQKG